LTSYSQYGEDAHILQVFDAPGRFLDIGAWHPKQLSNTRALYEAGWSGVVIEPSPAPFLAQLDEYGNDPRIMLVHAAIGFDRHCAKLYCTDDAVSTTEDAQYEAWKNHATYRGVFWVPMLTLEDIFNQFGTPGFDFVNIDVEGKSVDVFVALLATEALPKCVCVEHDNRIVEATQMAEKRGYKQIHLNGTNVIFAR
jgi:FkbM family methyltransferase